MGRFIADVRCVCGAAVRVGSSGLEEAAQDSNVCWARPVSVVVFVTALSGARGPGPSGVLPCPALGAFPGSLPALALMLCSHGNGDARQVSQEHHGCMKHMHLLA